VTALRIFFVGGLISFRALFGFMRPSVYVLTSLVSPIFQILLFVYIGRVAELESDEFYVVGNALQYASVPCLFAMTNTIAGERYQQTLAFVLATPAGRLPLFLGRSLPVIVNGALVAAFSLAAGALIVGITIPASAVPPLALVVLVTAFSCTGLGLITAGIALRVRESAVLLNIIFGFLLIFTGANVPLDTVPGWIEATSQAIPLTHGIEASRRLVDGAALGEIWGLIGAEAAVGVVYAFVGYGVLRYMETQSRRHATLEIA
jgi:ABC-2 type transport system permease protein